MRTAVISLIVLFNFILQSTLFQWIEIMGVKPNTAILIVLSYAMLRGDIEGAIIGFFAGLLQDIFYGQMIGMNALLCMMTGFLCGKPFRDFYRENYLIPVALALVSIVGYEFVFYVCNFLLQGRVHFAKYFNQIILPETVYTLLLSLPIYRFVYGINRRLETREKKNKSIF